MVWKGNDGVNTDYAVDSLLFFDTPGLWQVIAIYDQGKIVANVKVSISRVLQHG